MSAFPFSIFWRFIPFSIALTWLLYQGTTESIMVLIGAMIWLALSMLKSHFMLNGAARPNKNSEFVILTLILVEILALGLSTTLVFSLTPLLVVPLVDYAWYMQLHPQAKKLYVIIPCLLVLFTVYNISRYGVITKAEDLLYLLWWALLGILAALWLGSALGNYDSRRYLAHQYYDDLRLSQEALKKAHAELEAYHATLEEVSTLRERTRISRELHDSVGHALSTAYIQLQMLHHKLAQADSEHATSAQFLAHYIQETLTKTRQVVHHMGASAIEGPRLRYELAELMNTTEKLTGVSMRLIMPENHWPLDQDSHSCLYRAVQESITNALRHGRASKVQVVLAFSDHQVMATVQDNGIAGPGINGDLQYGFGLKTMSQRVQQLRGQLNVSSPGQGQGVLVRITLPRPTL